MIIIDILDIKKYLNIDISDTYEDDYLKELLAVAECYIEFCCGIGYKKRPEGLYLSDLLIKKLVSDMYENRGTMIANNAKRDIMVGTMLDALANMGDVNV